MSNIDITAIEELIPSFLEFLRRNGRVDIGEVPSNLRPFMLQRGVSPDKPKRPLGPRGDEVYGKRYVLNINGKLSGFLEVYEDPRALFYDGQIPGFNRERELSLGYMMENAYGRDKGRRDNWDQVPFP